MSKSRDIADSAATINFIDTLSSNAQTQLNAKQAADANLTSFLAALNLPTSDGTNGQAMVTNGSGTLSFADAGKILGTPFNVSPAASATNISTTPTLEASAYLNLDGIAQAASQWQVSKVSDFSSTVINTGDVAGTGKTYTIPNSAALDALTTHYWRMRYKDANGNYSGYSTGTSFATTAPVGQQAYTSAGTFYWTAPAGVTSVCVVVVGAGGSGMRSHDSCGGGGGALAYKNNYTVTPGNSYQVVVGSPGGVRSGDGSSGVNGGDSHFVSQYVCRAQGGRGGQQNSTTATSGKVGDGGGEGGGSTNNRGGACGAGGYSGNGGNSAYSNTQPGAAPSGGGGSASYNHDGPGSHGGGGVGILGEGSSGAQPGTSTSDSNGRGGSGGADGGFAQSGVNYLSSGTSGTGGNYGGGGGRGTGNSYGGAYGGAGGNGAVRIIWGSGRSFPSTNTTDQ